MTDECHQILSDLAIYLDGECPADVEHLVTAHLTDCPPCMDRADFERRLRAMLARSCKQRAPEDVIQRVRARLSDLA